MDAPIRLRKHLTPTEGRLLLYSIIIASVFAMVPQIVPEAKSYLSLALIAGGSIFSLIFIMIITEFGMTYFSTSGGIYTYISNTFSRFIAFVSALTVIFAGYLFVINDFLTHFTRYFDTNITLVIMLVVFLMIYILQVMDIDALSVLFALAVAVIPCIFFIWVIFLTGFSSAYPLVGPIDLRWGTIFLNSILPVLFTAIPFSFLIAEMRDSEEELPYMTKKAGLLFLILPLVAFILIMGTVDLFVLSKVPLYAEMMGSSDLLIQVATVAELCSHLMIAIFILYSLPRLLFQMSNDNLIPRYMSSAKGMRIPKRIFNLQMTMLLIFTLLFMFHAPLQEFYMTMWTGTIIISGLIVLGLPISRLRFPDLERFYAVKHWKLLPVSAIILLVAAFILDLMYGSIQFLVNYLIFMLALIPFYYMIEKWYNEELSSYFDEWLVPFQRFIQCFTFPPGLRKRLVNSLGNIRGKKILDYGARYGALTSLLSSKLGSKGVLYSTDISAKLIRKLKKRIKKKRFPGYNMSYTHLPSSVNLSVPKVNIIVSAFTLGRVRKVDPLLKQMNNALEISGSIVMLDFDLILHVIPNRWLNDDDAVKEFFDRNGFGVTIEKRRGLLGRYVIIKGIKFKDAYYLDTWYSGKDN